MNSTHDGYEFYKKILEMQEKLRKSEEERIRLEERFNLLEQESRIRHEACINKLRMRYIEFLEEQKLRDERNNRLLNTLDNVDTNLALMSAKTDRLQALRKEYEASVFRAGPKARSQAVSVTGDSGIVSHKVEKKSPKYHQWPLEPLYHQPRIPRLQSDQVQAPALQVNTSEKQQLDRINPPSIKWSNINWSREQIKNNHYPDGGTCPFRYPERITTSPKNSLMPSRSSSSSKEEYAGNILENELERYIKNIRSLHGQVDTPSCDEEENDYEENTSGDLLNVTFSDDGISDHLPVEEKKDKKQRNSSREIQKILALADDLVGQKFRDEKTQLFQGQSDIDENPPTLETKFLSIAASNESNQNIAQEVKPKINSEPSANQESQNLPENKENISNENEKTEVAQIQIEFEKIPCENEDVKVEDPIEELHSTQMTLNKLEIDTENDENIYENELLPGNVDAEPEIYNYSEFELKQGNIEYYQQGDNPQETYEQYDENAQYEYQEQYSPYDQQQQQQQQEENYSNNYIQDPNQEYSEQQQQQQQQQQDYADETYPTDYLQNQQHEYNENNYEYADYNEAPPPLESDNSNYPDNETTEIKDPQKIDESSAVDSTNNNDDNNDNDSTKNTRNVIKSILESDTDISTIENNASNTESDFDFN